MGISKGFCPTVNFTIYPKNILKKKSYFLKINRKNSKIDRRTKSFGYDIKKILKDKKKNFCPKVIKNIFYEFFPALSTIIHKLLKPGGSNTYLLKVNHSHYIKKKIYISHV